MVSTHAPGCPWWPWAYDDEAKRDCMCAELTGLEPLKVRLDRKTGALVLAQRADAS